MKKILLVSIISILSGLMLFSFDNNDLNKGKVVEYEYYGDSRMALFEGEDILNASLDRYDLNEGKVVEYEYYGDSRIALFEGEDILNASLDRYDLNWERVDDYEKKGDFRMALSESESILKASLDNGDYHQSARAMEKIANLELRLNWKMADSLYLRFVELESSFKGANGQLYYQKAMIASFLSGVGRKDYRDSPEILRRRFDKILALYEELSAFPSYAIEGDSFYTQFLDGQRCDDLSQESLLWVTRVIYDHLLGYDVESMVNYFLEQIYPLLHRATESNVNLRVKSEWLKVRFDYLGRDLSMVKPLQELCEKSPDVIAKAELLYNLILSKQKLSYFGEEALRGEKSIEDEDSGLPAGAMSKALRNEKIINDFKEIISIYPNSYYARLANSRIDAMKQPFLFVEGSGVYSPSEPVILPIYHTNIDEIEVQVYKLDRELGYYTENLNTSTMKEYRKISSVIKRDRFKGLNLMKGVTDTKLESTTGGVSTPHDSMIGVTNTKLESTTSSASTSLNLMIGVTDTKLEPTTGGVSTPHDLMKGVTDTKLESTTGGASTSLNSMKGVSDTKLESTTGGVSTPHDSMIGVTNTKLESTTSSASTSLNLMIGVTDTLMYNPGDLDKGVYIVEVNSKSDTAYCFVWRSSVGTFRRVYNGGNQFYVVDVASGKPFKEFGVKVLKDAVDRQGNIRRPNLLSEMCDTVLQQNGFTPIDNNKLAGKQRNNYCLIYTEQGGVKDIYTKIEPIWSYQSYYHDNTKKDSLFFANIYTDRKLYKPSDTVFFKGIEYSMMDHEYRVLKGREDRVYLYDSNFNKIDSADVVTNEFGSFNGKFELKGRSMNGNHFLGVSSIEGREVIRIEEYKPPTFIVEFDQGSSTVEFDKGSSIVEFDQGLSTDEFRKDSSSVMFDRGLSIHKYGDRVRVFGKVVSYSGYDISSAQLEYTITREQRFDRMMSYLFGSYDQSTIIESGKVETGDNGKFSIDFTAQRPRFVDEMIDGYESTFRITVSVTDPTGETYRSEKTMVIGDFTLSLSTDIDNVIVKEENPIFRIDIKNLSGDIQRMEGSYSITRVGDISRKRGEFPIDGSFSSNEPVSVQWSQLSSGEYDLEYSIRHRERLYKETKRIYVASVDDKILYRDNTLFFRALSDGNSFLVGTSEDKIYVEVEVFSSDSLIYREPLVISNGIIRYNLPKELDTKENKVILSLLTVKDGKVYQVREEVDIKSEQDNLSIKLVTEREDRGGGKEGLIFQPSSNEKLSFEIENRSGLKSELLLSVYNKSTDRIFRNMFDLYKNEPYPYAPYFYNNFTKQGNIRIRGLGDVGRSNYSGSFVDGSGGEYLSLTVSDSDVSELAVSENDVQGFFSHKKSASGSAAEIKGGFVPRSDFSETIAFIPDEIISSERLSIVEVPIKTADLLSTYRILAMIHNESVDFATAEGELIVRKEVMIQANYPTFLRERDRIILQAKAVNLTDKRVEGVAYIIVEDNENNKNITPSGRRSDIRQKIILEPNEQRVIKWEVDASSMAPMSAVTFVLDSPTHKDAERHIIPVLSMRERFTEADIEILNGKGNYDISGQAIYQSIKESDKRDVERVVLEVSSPILSAFESLPVLSGGNSPSILNKTVSIYADLLGNYMINNDPRLREHIEKVIDNSASLMSEVEYNSDLTGILLSETPWANLSAIERQKVSSFEKMMNDDLINSRIESFTRELKEQQSPDGGFSWYPGMRSSYYVTSAILLKLGELKKIGAFKPDAETMAVLYKSIDFMHDSFVKMFDDYKKSITENNSTDKTSIIPNYLEYIYVMRYYLASSTGEVEIKQLIEKQNRLSVELDGLLRDNWRKLPIMQKAMMAEMFMEQGDMKLVSEILESLDQYIVKDSRLGCYFPNAVMPYRGMISSEIKAHSILMNLYREASLSMSLSGDIVKSDYYTDISKGITQWLLLQKKNQQWGNNIATADVIFALIQSGEPVPEYDLSFVSGVLNKKESIGKISSNRYELNLSNKALRKSKLATIHKSDDGLLFANLFYIYTDDIENVAQYSEGFEIKTTLYRREIRNGKVNLNELKEGDVLNVGEEIVVRHSIFSDANRSFVQLKAMKAASLMPVVETSGYRMTGSSWCYREVGKSMINYYFDSFAEGHHTIEESFFVVQQGVFSTGLSEIQSLYAPEYRGRDEAKVLYSGAGQLR